jgi:DNA modification methylase
MAQSATRLVADLVPYARNARTHSPAQVEQIARSMLEFGWTAPVLVDEDDGIIAGHGRVLAAELIYSQGGQILGLDGAPLRHGRGPVLVAKGWSDAKKRAYVIVDNKLAENAGWDRELLRAEIAWLADEFNIDLLGFDDDELKALRHDRTKGKTDPDALPAQPAPASQPGDVWLLGQHRLLVGDATKPEDLALLMNGELADLVWTDPPYNVAISGAAGKIMNDDMGDAAFRAFLDATYANYVRAMRPGAVIYVAHADSERVNFTAAFVASGLKLSQVRIWVKQSATLSRQDFNWQHEPILYGWKEGAGHYFGRDFTKTTVIEDETDITKLKKPELLAMIAELRKAIKGTVIRQDRPTRSDLHPTMKPCALIEEMIENSSMEGDLVLDLFGGSGSTLITAEMTARRAFLMELDPKFADVIVARWEEFTGRVATLEATGQTYREVAHSRKAEEVAA